MQERERSLASVLDDEREAIGQIIARRFVELHPFIVLTGYDPKPVVLDFVQPDATNYQRSTLARSFIARTRVVSTRMTRNAKKGVC
jgi:hypothetical protein